MPNTIEFTHPLFIEDGKQLGFKIIVTPERKLWRFDIVPSDELDFLAFEELWRCFSYAEFEAALKRVYGFFGRGAKSKRFFSLNSVWPFGVEMTMKEIQYLLQVYYIPQWTRVSAFVLEHDTGDGIRAAIMAAHEDFFAGQERPIQCHKAGLSLRKDAEKL